MTEIRIHSTALIIMKTMFIVSNVVISGGKKSMVILKGMTTINETYHISDTTERS